MNRIRNIAVVGINFFCSSPCMELKSKLRGEELELDWDDFDFDDEIPFSRTCLKELATEYPNLQVKVIVQPAPRTYCLQL